MRASKLLREIEDGIAMLERDGFLESEWREIRKPIASGRAGRFFKLTHKVDDVIAELRSELEVIQ